MQTKGELVARERIELKPGFHFKAEPGKSLHLRISNYDTNDPAPPVASKTILSRKEPDALEDFISSFPSDMDEAVFPPFVTRYLQNPEAFQSAEVNTTESLHLAYPNPNNGTFKVALQTEWHTQKVILSDVSGKIIYELEIPQSETVFIDLPNVSKGLYQLSIFCNQGILTQKMMVQ